MRLSAEGCFRFNSTVISGTVKVLSAKKLCDFRDNHGKLWSLNIFGIVYVYSHSKSSSDTKWDNDEVWAYPIQHEDFET